MSGQRRMKRAQSCSGGSAGGKLFENDSIKPHGKVIIFLGGMKGLLWVTARYFQVMAVPGTAGSPLPLPSDVPGYE